MDIFKSTSYSGKYTRAAICPGSNKKYEDDRVKAGHTYYYKVRRLRAYGEDEITYGPFSEPKKAIVEENGCTLKWDTSNDINNNNFDIYT